MDSTDNQYCLSCNYRHLCKDKAYQLPGIDWCKNCSAQLKCVGSWGTVMFVVICAKCGFVNRIEFRKCLCNGASSTGRLRFPCRVCKKTALYLGTGRGA